MKKSGIYQILNTVNNKFYIGSAVYFYDRWNTHKYCLRQDKHKNKYLQSAWNKYGEDAFEFRVLEYCDKNDLLKKEQGWLDWTKCYERDIGYNLFKTAGSALGTKWTEERKVIHSNFMKGFRHTEEAKEKMRGRIKSKEEVEKTRLSKLGKPRSEETKEKIKMSNLGKSRNKKEDKWPHGSKCRCDDCKIIKNTYLRYYRKNRLDLWHNV